MPRAVAKDSLGTIASYPILGRLSVGGQGTVYKARDPLTGGDLAIKVLSEQMVKDPVLRCASRKNARSRAACVIRTSFASSISAWTATSPIWSWSSSRVKACAERLDRDGRLTESEAVKIITQIGEALQSVHDNGLLHRDVTPDNILVTVDGDAKLTDLGLVKNTESDFNLTQTQSCLGTPNFMAPEQFEDSKRVDALSDLYGLAATMYTAVTGELPFRARSAFALGAIYKKKLSNDLAAPRAFAPELSERLEAAILRALRADRKERPGSVREFLELLQEPVIDEVPEPAPAPEPAPKKATGSDRRRAPRVSVTIGAACRPLERNADAAWRGSLVNISETGMCLELRRKFEPGALLSVSLGGRKHRRRSLLARVMWVKRAESGRWHLGCHYDQPLREGEIEDLT